jgi:L-lactate dehydrogenase complex protein LldG
VTRKPSAGSLAEASGRDALVAEFVESWRGLEGDAWIVRGGRDEVRRTIVEAARIMVEDGGPATSCRVLAWSTADLASLDLPGLLAQQGWEHVPWPTGARAGEAAAEVTRTQAELVTLAAASDLGITTCAWAVAETGTIALYATPATGRLPSLLPTAHLALVRPSQVVRTVPDGLRLLAEYMAREGDSPSAVNLVSGPSRSADIEGDLAVGVHGPRRAGVIIGEW